MQLVLVANGTCLVSPGQYYPVTGDHREPAERLYAHWQSGAVLRTSWKVQNQHPQSHHVRWHAWPKCQRNASEPWPSATAPDTAGTAATLTAGATAADRIASPHWSCHQRDTNIAGIVPRLLPTSGAVLFLSRPTTGNSRSGPTAIAATATSTAAAAFAQSGAHNGPSANDPATAATDRSTAVAFDGPTATTATTTTSDRAKKRH